MDASEWYEFAVEQYTLELLRSPFGKADRQAATHTASRRYGFADPKRPSFGGKAERALKEAFAQLKEETIDKYIIRPETLEHHFHIPEGPKFNQDPEQPWNNAPDWFMNIAVSDAFKDAAMSAKQPHYLGILWNLTREASHADPIVWSSMLRKLGIDGIVDTNKGSVIHGAEPTQAVFFSRGDLELVETFSNELTPSKVLERGASETLPIFHRTFIEKWGRKPSTDERDKFIYRVQERDFVTQAEKVGFANYQAQEIGEETEFAARDPDLSKHTL